MRRTPLKMKCFVLLLAGSLVLTIAVLGILSDSHSVSSPPFTNILVQTYQTRWQQRPPLKLEGIERAERINEQMMWRSQDQWKRLQELRSPRVPSTLLFHDLK